MADSPTLTLGKLDKASDLTALRKDVKDSRQRLEILWKLGVAFYRGRQYTFYSTTLRRIQQLPTDDTKPRGKTRIVSNQIKPNCNKLVAKLTKNKAQFTATAGNGDPNSQKAARLVEAAADYWWTALDLQRKYRQALTWARVAGQGYWLIGWDAYAGEPFSYVCHPESGDPVPPDVAGHYQSEYKNMGGDPQDIMRTAYKGELSVTSVSPMNVWLDNSVETFSDCKYAGVDLHLTPEEVKTRWGVDIVADSVLTDADLGAQTNDLDNAKKTVVVVTVLYIRPCPSLPSGRVVYFTKDKILEDNRQWPFPFKHLPIVKFGSTPIPNSVYDSGEVEDAIPLNKELNKTLSQILTHRDLTINPKWTVPRNSVQSFNAADEIQHYNPINGQKPEMVNHPGLPAYMAEILQDMNARIKNAFGLGDTNTNQAGQPGLESGIALDLAQEESDEVIAPIILDNELSLGHALQMLTDLAGQRYTTERLLKITGENGMPQIIAFKGTDARNVSVKCEASSSMPTSKAGRMARVMFLKQNGLLPAGSEHKYLDMPDLKGWRQQMMLDADMADREHMRILQGQPVNPVALQAAQGQIQTGVNPQTGLPFQDAAEIQGFLLQAMLSPTDYEDWNAHYTFHTQYMKSTEFENLAIDIQHEFMQHTDLTLQKIVGMQTATKQREGNVKVGLTAHTVLGPEATAMVLTEAGVQNVDGELLKTEAPMESIVMQTDSLDKPNADSGASGTTSGSPTPSTKKAASSGKSSTSSN